MSCVGRYTMKDAVETSVQELGFSSPARPPAGALLTPRPAPVVEEEEGEEEAGGRGRASPRRRREEEEGIIWRWCLRSRRRLRRQSRVAQALEAKTYGWFRPPVFGPSVRQSR